VKSLRDVSQAMLHEHIREIPPQIYMRCMYVVEENERVLLAGTCLQEANLEMFGELMYASHTGLQKQYEVSCEELDYLVELTLNREEVIGARMMGGGFGGCTINIVHRDGLEDFKQYMTSQYEKKFHRVPEIYVGQIVEGCMWWIERNINSINDDRPYPYFKVDDMLYRLFAIFLS